MYVATHPHCTVSEVARGLYLTHRTAYAHTKVLRKAGALVVVADVDRRQHFTVDGTAYVEVLDRTQRLKDLFAELGK